MNLPPRQLAIGVSLGTMTQDPVQIDATVPPSGTGCAECMAAGGWWMHLRRCAACGHVGCCDTSPMQHASAHFRETGHRYMQSFEPGEEWYWDFVDQSPAEGPRLADPTSHPEDQPAPGPSGKVPRDWLQRIH
jgi:Zn-finger in ubiquitin-hydrolases and other protein